MTATARATALALAAARGADDKMATETVAIDVSDLLVLTDIFVVCSAGNGPHAHAIVDEVERQVRAAGGDPPKREGRRDASWILMDFGEIVVHVQLDQDRREYALERLWGDCPRIDLPQPEPAS